MDDPPPPYSSIDESKGASYPPRNFYPAGPNVSQNQYGATSYPASSPYQEAPRSGRGAGSSFYPATSEHQPQIIIAPAGFWRFGGVQSIRQKYSTYGRHIMLSCFVICCCFPSGLLCGLLAFCIAICAQSVAESSPQLSRQLGQASMALSMAGITVSFLAVIIVFSTGSFHGHPRNLTADSNDTVIDCLYLVRDRCFNVRERMRSMRSCNAVNGYYLYPYCYRNQYI